MGSTGDRGMVDGSGFGPPADSVGTATWPEKSRPVVRTPWIRPRFWLLSLLIPGLVIALAGAFGVFVRAVVPLDAVAAYQPTPGAHAFLYTRDDGVTPVTFESCRPIPYVLRAEHAPAGALTLVSDAVARVSLATGLTFVFAGWTDEVPTETLGRQPGRYAGSSPPVLIAFATGEESPTLAGPLLGWTDQRPTLVGGMEAYTSGRVALQADWMADKMDSPITRSEARAVPLHELGHLVGLNHVDDPSQLMYRTKGSLRDYQGGDLDGLAALGRGPCTAAS